MMFYSSAFPHKKRSKIYMFFSLAVWALGQRLGLICGWRSARCDMPTVCPTRTFSVISAAANKQTVCIPARPNRLQTISGVGGCGSPSPEFHTLFIWILMLDARCLNEYISSSALKRNLCVRDRIRAGSRTAGVFCLWATMSLRYLICFPKN